MSSAERITHRIDTERLRIGLFPTYPVNVEGGVQNNVLNCAQCLENMGHQVIIIAPKYGEETEQVNVIHLGRGRKFPIRVEGTTSVFEYLPSPALLNQVRRLKKEHPLDIAHYHEPEISPGSLAHLWNSEAALNVVTFHAVKRGVLLYFILTPLVPLFRDKIDARIAVSPVAREFVKKYFPGNYDIIPNGVDTSYFHPNVPKLPQFSDDKLNILFVGRLEERKGTKYLIDAYSRFKKGFEDSRLIIVGAGPKEKDLRKQVEVQNIKDVHFEGKVPTSQLPSYYSTAEFVCSPATDGESQGVVILEAMAAGNPVIAGNNSGYKTLVTHDENGFLVDPTNCDELVDCLRRLAENKDLRARMGRNGRTLSEQYDWEKVSRQLLNLYLAKLMEKGVI